MFLLVSSGAKATDPPCDGACLNGLIDQYPAAYFADPKAGRVGFYGTIEEHGHPAIPGLRLKNRKICGRMGKKE
jgi:hypothetical protein